MKKILSIALVMALVAGATTVNAQTPSTTKTDKTEQCDRTGKDNKDRKDKKDKKGCKNHRHDKGKRSDLFTGITLSADQKTKINALKKSTKEARQSQPQAKLTKEEKQARRAAFNAKVKEILTPEQWTVYQQNLDKKKAKRDSKKKS